jgi:hypothetical protein
MVCPELFANPKYRIQPAVPQRSRSTQCMLTSKSSSSEGTKMLSKLHRKKASL